MPIGTRVTPALMDDLRAQMAALGLGATYLLTERGLAVCAPRLQYRSLQPARIADRVLEVVNC